MAIHNLLIDKVKYIGSIVEVIFLSLKVKGLSKILNSYIIASVVYNKVSNLISNIKLSYYLYNSSSNINTSIVAINLRNT